MKQLLKALNMIRLCDQKAFWLRIFYVVVQSVLPLLSLYILKFMVDSVTDAKVQTVLGYQLDAYVLLGIFCFLFLLNRVVNLLSSVNTDIMSQRLIDYLSDRMQKQSAR